jgi:hypothetical protein
MTLESLLQLVSIHSKGPRCFFGTSVSCHSGSWIFVAAWNSTSSFRFGSIALTWITRSYNRYMQFDAWIRTCCYAVGRRPCLFTRLFTLVAARIVLCHYVVDFLVPSITRSDALRTLSLFFPDTMYASCCSDTSLLLLFRTFRCRCALRNHMLFTALHVRRRLEIGTLWVCCRPLKLSLGPFSR